MTPEQPLDNGLTPWQRKHLRLEITHPSVQTMADAVEAFAGRWFRREPSQRLLVLSGITGCGKTHCLHAIERVASLLSVTAYTGLRWPHPPTLWSVEWPRVVATCDDSTEDSVLTDCNDADLLLVDEIGAESDRYRSGHSTGLLASLLNRRIDTPGLYTLITTNVPPSEWSSRWDARIENRLLRGSVVVDLSDAPSYTTIQPL